MRRVGFNCHLKSAPARTCSYNEMDGVTSLDHDGIMGPVNITYRKKRNRKNSIESLSLSLGLYACTGRN